MGYGPGVACFIVFGIMAAYSGVLLWHMFLKLDSDRFPLRSFGDLGYRIYGSWFRICTPFISFDKHVTLRISLLVCNVLQSLQLIFNVGIIILSNGQGLSQMAQFKVWIGTAITQCSEIPYKNSFASVSVTSSGC